MEEEIKELKVECLDISKFDECWKTLPKDLLFENIFTFIKPNDGYQFVLSFQNYLTTKIKKKLFKNKTLNKEAGRGNIHTVNLLIDLGRLPHTNDIYTSLSCGKINTTEVLIECFNQMKLNKNKKIGKKIKTAIISYIIQYNEATMLEEIFNSNTVGCNILKDIIIHQIYDFTTMCIKEHKHYMLTFILDNIIISRKYIINGQTVINNIHIISLEKCYGMN
jgi:hypothetical protein